MIGSTFIVEATSIDEVQKLVEGDIYYKAGVVSRTDTSWDGVSEQFMQVGCGANCYPALRRCDDDPFSGPAVTVDSHTQR